MPFTITATVKWSNLNCWLKFCLFSILSLSCSQILWAWWCWKCNALHQWYQAWWSNNSYRLGCRIPRRSAIWQRKDGGTGKHFDYMPVINFFFFFFSLAHINLIFLCRNVSFFPCNLFTNLLVLFVVYF